MKITAVRADPYHYRMTRKIGDAHLPEGTDAGADVAVHIDTDEGVTGVAVGMGHGPAEIDRLAPLLVGEDPRSVRGLWERMTATVFKMGLSGTPKFAIASLDCALWDLRAKINGVPLWKELGAIEGRVRAYASGLDMPLDDSALGSYYRRMAQRGINAGKLKVGRDIDNDLRRLAIVDEALAPSGRSPVLMVDANEFWAPKQAIRRIRRMEENFDLLWVEEPAGRRDITGLRRVSEAVTAAVATGENLDTAGDFAALIAGEAVDIVQLSFGLGITGSLQVAELAYASGLPVTMSNCPGRHMAHLAAALPHHLMMEVLDCGRDQAFHHESTLEDGAIVLGSSPGSGIQFDRAFLEDRAVETPPPDSLGASYRRDKGTWVHE